MPTGPSYRPEPRITELGPAFYDAVEPARFPEHRLRWRNQEAAAEVGLDALSEVEWLDAMARFEALPGNLEGPLALRYHGHQFGYYNPRLGDGRGFLAAQVREAGGRQRLMDLGTKGSGQTPWSRGGDGRLTLKGAFREILAAELLQARGVDTCRILSVVETGEELFRNDEPSPTRSAVMVRLNHSHVRIGTFQRLAFFSEEEALSTLVDYCCRWLHPELDGATDKPAALLRKVAQVVGRTAGAWMAAGFVHGVLNTDNINITGESFDYGPWRFMAVYDPDFTAAYFDQGGRYRFSQQPPACFFALEQLARSLTPIGQPATLGQALQAFRPAYGEGLNQGVLARLGLRSAGAEADRELVGALFGLLEAERLPFDQLFHDWLCGAASQARAMAGPASRHYKGPAFDTFRRALDAYEADRPERLDHPLVQAPRPVGNEYAVVEELWTHVSERDDWQPLADHVAAIRELALAS